MEDKLVISIDLFEELVKINQVIGYLTTAQEAAKKSLDMMVHGNIYKGKATDEMVLFYEKSVEHLTSLLLLYSNAYDYAWNAITIMIEKDNEIARNIKAIAE